MIDRPTTIPLTMLLGLSVLLVPVAAQHPDATPDLRANWRNVISYHPKPAPTRILELHGRATLKILLERCNLGSSEVEIAYAHQQPYKLDASGQPLHEGHVVGFHAHASVEVWYVLEGTLRNDFIDPPENAMPRHDTHHPPKNYKSYTYKKGETAIVRPGDQVRHVAVGGPLKALLVWAPGGEVDRFVDFGWKQTVLDPHCKFRPPHPTTLAHAPAKDNRANNNPLADTVPGVRKSWQNIISYQPKPIATRNVGLPGQVNFKALVDRLALGSSEVEVAHAVQQAPDDPAKVGFHNHASMEVWYILKGTLRNDFLNPPANDHKPPTHFHSYTYGAGEIALIRAGDHVRHIAVDDAVEAILIWAPAGELSRLGGAPGWYDIRVDPAAKGH